MRVAPYFVILVLLCSGASGCALFGKKSSDPGKGAWPSASDRQPAKRPIESRDPLIESTGFTQEVQGQLNGQVLDRGTGQPIQASIRVVSLDDPQPKGAPIDSLTNDKGFFTISDLKPGKRYKLLTRTMRGGKLIAATSYATPPTPHPLVIQLSSEFVTPEIPPVPPPPSLGNTPKQEGSAGANGLKGKANQPSANNKGFDLGAPSPLGESAQGPAQPPDWAYPPGQPGTPKSNPQNIQNIVQGENPQPYSPAVTIPNPAKGRVPPPPPLPVDAPSDTLLKTGTPVPSAVLLGSQQLINCAFRDVYGDVWEWKGHRRGKVVLLDFWQTTCLPCRASIPELRVLQEKYGPQGLEVIGVATESAGSFEKEKYKVAALANILHTNYRLLLNSGPDSQNVLAKFGVHAFPTLLLVNERGQILWRHVGAMNVSDREALEHQIRRELKME